MALAVFALKPSACLLLDEPSNHLDVETVEVLGEALRGYDGSLVAVTHSRAFAEAQRPTHTCLVRGGRVEVHDRPLSDADFQHDAAPAGDQAAATAAAADPPKPRAKSSNAEQRKAKSRLNNIIKTLDREAEKLEAIDQELLAAMGDRALVDEVNSKRRAVEAKMEALELEWEELELML